MLIRTFRYRLRPSAEQAAQLTQFAGACRFIFNLALEQRRDFWRAAQRAGTRITFATQSRELTALRAEHEWLRAVERQCQEQALRDLDKAFTAFFQGGGGFPRFRKQGVNESVRFRGMAVRTRQGSGRWAEACLPKIGWVRYRDTRPLRGEVRTVTLKQVAGDWYISFAAAIEADPPANDNPAIGVDRGIANTVSLSNGVHLSLPESLDEWDRKLRKARRQLSRRTRGSKRHAKARLRVARIAAKAARIRRDWHHRATTEIARGYGLVAIEDLQTRSMMAAGAHKRGLNRSIANQGWRTFETMLVYKLEERGGRMVKVPAAYSSQTCAACGIVNRNSRKSQAVFACVECGHEDHADTNAAREILRRSSASMGVEGSQWAPVEALTRVATGS